MPPTAAGLSDPSIPTLPTPRWAGQASLHASAAGKAEDSGFVYEYVIAGKVDLVPVPPASFKPTSASNAQFAEYGFPLRPASSTQQAAWANEFADFRGVPPPALCLADHANTANQGQPSAGPTAARPTVGTPTAANSTSNNWGGTVTDGGERFVAIQGGWGQSAAGACGCGTADTDESTWTGLGGWASPGLLQEGTDMQGTPSSMYTWYEYLHYCTTAGCNPPEIALNSVPSLPACACPPIPPIRPPTVSGPSPF